MSQNNGINTMPSMTAAAGFRLLFALSLLVPAGYFAVSALESRQRTLREADQHIVTTVRLLSEQMNKVLQMDDLALTQVDELVRGMSWDEIRQSARLPAQLRALQARLPQADGISLIAPDGRPTASSFWSSPPPIDAGDRDFFVTLRDHADLGVYVSRSYPGKVFPAVHFQVARRRTARAGVFDGVIVMSTRPSYLTDFYATFAGPDGMTIALLRRDGAVLARYPAGDATAAFPPDDPLIAVASKTASGVVTLYSPHYRQTRLAGFAQVADSDLVVTYALSRDGVLAPWRSDLLRYGLLTALGSLALATMTGIAMVNAHRVAAARRHLETINAALAQEVADRLRIEAELRELNRHLEARVASRTASLADIAIQRGQEVTFLAAVLEASPYAELVIDTGGTIILVNAAAERLLGYRREALIGQGVDVLVPETLRGGHVALRKAFMEAPVGRAMGEGLELLGRRQDGTPVPVEILLAPLQTRDGMAVIVGIADISARKQHEAALTQANVELRAANQDLRQANAVSQHRREEVEAFVHIISHDLRTPLITLQGFSREMELGGAELRRMVAALDLPAETGLALRNLVEQDIDSPLKYIRASIRRFDRLINSLLELSRTGRFPLQNEPLQVGAIVAAILEALQQAALAAGARVEVGSLPDATGDGGAVGQIFANLIENSLKYTDPKREPRIEIGGETDGTMVRYWVRDNGVGIPDGARARLFQVFQRFHPKLADGDGIGLASVRRLVERHGGTVWADSEVGTGTTFYFTLPAMPRQEASS